MKIKKGFEMRETAGVGVVVDTRGTELNFNSLITLNGSGLFLWRKLEVGSTKEELLAKLLDEYDVTKAEAENDLSEFLEKLKAADLIE